MPHGKCLTKSESGDVGNVPIVAGLENIPPFRERRDFIFSLLLNPEAEDSNCISQNETTVAEGEHMIRILIADDHPRVLAGLKNIIGKAPDMVVAAEASNGFEIVNTVRQENIDLLLIDFDMPRMDGLEVLEKLHRDQPNLPVLILSQHPEDQLALRLLKAGAAGFMAKESVGKFLIDAIRLVHSGGKYVSSTLIEQLVGDATHVCEQNSAI
jgi:CheY-like chemotaxis protein